jgi:hypothetical protein
MITTRPLHCVVCLGLIDVLSRTNTDPECPEFIKVPPSTWIGFVRGDHAPEMIVFCSDACCNIFFRNANE